MGFWFPSRADPATNCMRLLPLLENVTLLWIGSALRSLPHFVTKARLHCLQRCARRAKDSGGKTPRISPQFHACKGKQGTVVPMVIIFQFIAQGPLAHLIEDAEKFSNAINDGTPSNLTVCLGCVPPQLNRICAVLLEGALQLLEHACRQLP